jgi:hypothetical protein
MVAQEQRPLATVRYSRCLSLDVEDRERVFLPQRHEQAGHQGELEGHVALVPGPEVGCRFIRPLVGLRQEHPIAVPPVDVGAELLKEGVGLGEVLTTGTLALEEVRHRVEA